METFSAIPFVFTTSQHLYYLLISSEGYYRTANPVYLRTCGLNELALSGSHLFATVFPADHSICAAAIAESNRFNGKPVTADFRILDAQGRLLSTRWEMISAKQEGETCIRCVGYELSREVVATDTLASYQNRISSIEALNEQLLSNSVDVFFLVNETYQISYCSSNVKRVLGFEASEMTGLNGFSFLHPDDREIAAKVFEEEIRHPDSNHSIDIRVRLKNGSWKWVEAKGRNLFGNPLVQAMLLNLNDISLRKRSEQALAESERRYKSFFHQLPVPLFILCNDKQAILDVNQCAVETYGYSREEFATFSFAQLFQDPVLCSEIEELCSSGKPVYHNTKSGASILVKIEKQEFDFTSKPGHVIMVTDITESNYMQQVSELGYEVSEILIQPRLLSVNLEAALKRIRLFTGWDLAEMWVPSSDGQTISCETVDYAAGHHEEEINQFIRITNEYSYPIKDYDPRVIKVLRPYWIEDIAENPFNFKRKQDAINCGFQSSFILPVLNDNQVVFLFTFFSFKQKRVNKNEKNLIGILGKLFSAEIEKRKNSLMLDSFFQISNDILTIAGLDGRYLRVNPAFEQFIGYSSEEAKLIHPLSYTHPEDRAMVLEKLKGLSNGVSVPYFENRVVTKAGVTKWIAWTATPVLTEGIVIASHRDITAQKQVEEELRITNERYELIRHATNEAIWDFNMVTNQIIMNEGYKTLFGHDFRDARNELDYWVSNIHPKDRDRVVNGFNEFLTQTKETRWECEYRFRKDDDSYADVLDKGYMLFNSEHRPVRVLGAMTDITERKKLEQELIEREIAEQNQIAQAVVFAQEKERAEIGKELHDNVGQLLTTTKLYIEMLKHNPDEPMDIIDRSARHINQVIQAIRNLSHSLVPSSIKDLGLMASVNDLIENIQALESIEINYFSSPELENKIEENVKLTLYRILQEQLSNIIRYAGATHVTIELFEENNQIHLIITDNGKGFNLKTVKKGLGLKNITSRTKLLNGSVKIKTNPGEGCKVVIQVPLRNILST